MKRRATDPRRDPDAASARAMLALLAALAPLGCGREFFREWANQDVSEAIFEKSRDPRWRIDVFSIDPPGWRGTPTPTTATSRPRPPDDYATQALSPVPQWSYNRLIVPVEGTGYLAMLEQFQSEHPTPDPAAPRRTPPRPRPMPGPRRVPAPPTAPRQPPAVPPAVDPLDTPPIPGDPNPGEPRTSPQPIGPVRDPVPRRRRRRPAGPPAEFAGRRPAIDAHSYTRSRAEARDARHDAPRRAPRAGSDRPGGPQARTMPTTVRDNGVRLAAMQAPAPPPARPPPDQNGPEPARPRAAAGHRPAGQRQPEDRPAADPRDPRRPRPPRGPGPLQPDQPPSRPDAAAEPRGRGRRRRAGGAARHRQDRLRSRPRRSACPRDARPYKINMAQAITLALINARVYQYPARDTSTWPRCP